jgi:hypothetical protein
MAHQRADLANVGATTADMIRVVSSLAELHRIAANPEAVRSHRALRRAIDNGFVEVERIKNVLYMRRDRGFAQLISRWGVVLRGEARPDAEATDRRAA